MLFFIFIIALVVGIVLLFLGTRSFSYDTRQKYPILQWIWETDGVIGGIITAISSICVVASLMGMIGTYTTIDAYVEKNNIKYESICYKLETESAKDEFGIRDKDIIDEVQDWNEDLIYHQTMQDNFWLGIYYPNVYDQFKIIELK